MTSTLSDVPSEMTPRPFPSESPQNHLVQALTKDELDGILRELDVPFAANLVQWRVTEWNDDWTLAASSQLVTITRLTTT